MFTLVYGGECMRFATAREARETLNYMMYDDDDCVRWSLFAPDGFELESSNDGWPDEPYIDQPTAWETMLMRLQRIVDIVPTVTLQCLLSLTMLPYLKHFTALQRHAMATSVDIVLRIIRSMTRVVVSIMYARQGREVRGYRVFVDCASASPPEKILSFVDKTSRENFVIW